MRVVRQLGVAAVVLGAFAVALAAGRAEEKKEGQGVKVGDKAPAFEATDDTGKEWKSADHVGKKIMVIYFYPADFTGGCTKQACAYRDESTKLKDRNVEVVGISGDSAKNHEMFKKFHKLNFTLLADEDGSIAKKFGVPVSKGGEVTVKELDNAKIKQGVRAERWTIVIGSDGKILYKGKVNAPAEDAKNVLAVIQKNEK